jgi:hypothetical protein
VISQRAQTILLLCVLAFVGAVIAAMIQLQEPEPPATAPTPASQLDSGSQLPAGMLQFRPGPDGTIIRIWSGSCHGGGPPTIELSDDDGWYFRAIRPPQVDDGTGISAASPAVSVVVAIDTPARREFVVWGADKSCKVRSYATKDGGTSWRQGNLPATAWRVDPGSGIVFSARGPASITCDGIRTLNGFDEDRAVATCLDRSVHISEDGETWESAPDLDDATTAVVFASTRQGYSLRKEPNCGARLYATNNGGERWTAGGCVTSDLSIPAIGVTPNLLVAGGSGPVWISRDKGRTWKRPVNPSADPDVLRRRLTANGDEPSAPATDEATAEPTPDEVEEEDE